MRQPHPPLGAGRRQWRGGWRGSGRIVGVEALVRWNCREMGQLSPSEFIPVAEESGIIVPLGHWVLETACAQIAEWAGDAATAHLSIAVNVSARQFQNPDFVDQVMAAIQRQGIQLQLDSGFVEPARIPLYNYYVGKFAYNVKDYMPARAALERAISE